MAVETLAQHERPHSQYIDFWNSVLVPKFIRWKHILVDGLTLHSEAIFPTLPVKPGDKVVDAGCGFGDTAIKLARLVGPSGSVWRSIAVMLSWSSVAKTRRQRELPTSRSWMRTCRHTHSNLFTISAFRDLAHSSSRTP